MGTCLGALSCYSDDSGGTKIKEHNMDGAWHTGHALAILIRVAVTVVTT